MIASANSVFIGGGAGVVDTELENSATYFYLQLGGEFQLESDDRFNTNAYFEYGNITSDVNSEGVDVDLDYHLFTANFSASYTYNNLVWIELGAGIGAATTTLSALGVDFDETVFVGQVFANIGFDINEQFQLYAGLKYIYTGDAEVVSGVEVDGLSDLAVQAGLRISF